MILTLTVNPAIDRNVTADRLVFEDRAYILAESHSAGGRGINASCVIHSFGGETAAIVPSGGSFGARFEQLLSGCGFPVHVVRIENEVRRNLTITDKTGLTVKLNELGPPMSGAELRAIEAKVLERLAGADWLLICGSLPPTVPPGFYSGLLAMAREHGVRTLLDTDGNPLREGVEAGPTVVAPNQQEAERLLNRALITRTHFIEAVDRIRQMGPEAVVLSLGSRGAIGAAQDVMLEAVTPRIEAVCPIGAGDALVAAFAWAMHRKDDFADALRWGVAAGTASAKLPGMTFASLAQTREIYERVEIRQIR
ncbi:MAG: 1-phosphofructokinase family hexose kinase [Bryobacterales bacterium]|nr:1-phosphofructokinase family hexose kinase [Bryobacterales bacterium]